MTTSVPQTRRSKTAATATSGNVPNPATNLKPL